MIIAGAALIILVLDRFPVLVWLGAMLLGWIAGDVISSDPAVEPLLHRLLAGRIAFEVDGTSAMFGLTPHLTLEGELAGTIASVLGALIVLVAGTIWRKRKLAKAERIVLSADTARMKQN
jgi:hypothetical protein